MRSGIPRFYSSAMSPHISSKKGASLPITISTTLSPLVGSVHVRTLLDFADREAHTKLSASCPIAMGEQDMTSSADPASSHIAQAHRALRVRWRNLSAQLAVTILIVYLTNALFTLILRARTDGLQAMAQPQNLTEAFLATQTSLLSTQLPLILIAIVLIQLFLFGHALVSWIRRRLADRRFYQELLPEVRSRYQQTGATVSTQFFADIDQATAAMRDFAQQHPPAPTEDVQEQVAAYRQRLAEEVNRLNQQTDAALLPRIKELAEADRIFKALKRRAMLPGDAVEKLVNLKSMLTPLLERMHKEYEMLRIRDDRLENIGAWFGEDPGMIGYVQDKINTRQKVRRYILPVMLPAVASIAARFIGLLTSH
jgi:hypothetical protein